MPVVNDLANELRKLQERAPARSRLPPAVARPPIVAGIGVGEPEADAAAAGGIASPVTEVADTRVFHDQDITSPDGLLVLENTVTQTITASDADGNSVVMNLDNPYD